MAAKLLSLALTVAVFALEIEGKHSQLANQRAHDNEAFSGRKLRSIIDVPRYTHKLRVCNAFTDDSPVELLHHKKTHSAIANLTKGGLLSYKACQDFLTDLVRHDSVEFRQNSKHLSSFSVSSLPQRDALLVLVLHSRDGSKRPTFASHVFSSNPHPQVVVLDMFSGSSKGHLAIKASPPPEPPADGKKTKEVSSMQMESLAYSTVVQVNPGEYNFILVGGSRPAKAPLSVKDGESYVAMRVGTEGKAEFPEEIIAFPQSSASVRNCFPHALALVVLFQFFWYNM